MVTIVGFNSSQFYNNTITKNNNDDLKMYNFQIQNIKKI